MSYTYTYRHDYSTPLTKVSIFACFFSFLMNKSIMNFPLHNLFCCCCCYFLHYLTPYGFATFTNYKKDDNMLFKHTELTFMNFCFLVNVLKVLGFDHV